jgi:hypothetical protein
MEVSGLDSAMNLAGTSGTQEVTITVSDVDGSIKELLSTCDVHLRPARVYQYFLGLDYTDRFMLLTGRVNSPIAWDGLKRTFTFTICTRLESEEVGFSAESADFPYMPSELVGRSWPIVFGTVQDIPATRISSGSDGSGVLSPPSQPTTYTRTGVGILSGMDLWEQLPDTTDDSDYILSLLVKLEEKNHLENVRLMWQRSQSPAAAQNIAELDAQIFSVVSQINTSAADRQKQIACAAARRAQQIAEANAQGLGPNPIKTTGGEDFPSGTIEVEINGGIFKGYFNGSDFYVLSRRHPKYEEAAQDRYTDRTTDPPECVDATVREQYYSFVSQVPAGHGGQYPGTSDTTYITSGKAYLTAQSGTRADHGTTPIVQQFWADAGTPITIYHEDGDGDEPLQYVAAAVSGAVLSVKAYKQVGATSRLTVVPSSYYSVYSRAYGDMNVIFIGMPRRLSSIDDNWSDDLYVTFKSDIGPNPIDVLTYIIDNYTDLTYDAVSFAAAADDLARMPINCQLSGTPDAVTLLQDLAFQLRSAVWIKDETVYIKYLPKIPVAVDTITLSDIDADYGVNVMLTPTEDLVTKMTAQWQMTEVPIIQTSRVRQEQKIVLRHNIMKYGTHAATYNFYAFNQPEIVNKCATFWLIRRANTWQEVRFRTYLTKLNLEPLDAVYLDFGSSYLTEAPVLAVVKSAIYDSADNTVEFVCETSLKAGTTSPYRFYWPAELPSTDTWPTAEEIVAGNAGRGQIATEVTGELPLGDTSGLDISGAIFVGGSNVVFGPHNDYGDSTPSDVNFVAKETYIPPEEGDYSEAESMPALDLQNYSRPKTPPLSSASPAACGGLSEIDLNTTVVQDANGNSSYLSDVLRFSKEGVLCIRADALVCNDTNGAYVFDFKYDSATRKYGAGTAFLQS